MKVALLSDIHGNSVALKAVLLKIKKEGIKKLFIMGDLVGYYYNHDKVLALLEKFDWEGVCGNHDKALANFLSGKKDSIEEYRSKFGSSLDVVLEKLTDDQIKMLIALPEKKEIVIDGKKILICHGSPWKLDDYIYPNSPASVFKKMAQLGYDFVFMGNTHYPLVKKSGKTLIINPGSVGQPRDYGSRASWAVVDLARSRAFLKRLKFKPDEILKQIQVFDPSNQYLSEVLLRKRSIYAS